MIPHTTLDASAADLRAVADTLAALADHCARVHRRWMALRG